MKFGRQDNESIKHFADVTIDLATVLCREICPGNHGYADYCSDCEVRRIFVAAKIAKSNVAEEIRWIDREEGGGGVSRRNNSYEGVFRVVAVGQEKLGGESYVAPAAPAAEPLSAILADFRQFALRAANEDKIISPESVLLLADKAEAAAERERQDAMKTAFLTKCKVCEKVGPASAPGNAAAMRAALERCAAFAANAIDYDGPERDREADMSRQLERISQTALAALSAPIRNCDRYATVEEAGKVYDREFPNGHAEHFDEWLFAPAEGGAE